jgi:hypothetical protein
MMFLHGTESSKNAQYQDQSCVKCEVRECIVLSQPASNDPMLSVTLHQLCIHVHVLHTYTYPCIHTHFHMQLYVGSLPPTFTDDQLRAMFEPFTKVTFATVIIDQLTVGARKCCHMYDYVYKHTCCLSIRDLGF